MNIHEPLLHQPTYCSTDRPPKSPHVKPQRNIPSVTLPSVITANKTTGHTPHEYSQPHKYSPHTLTTHHTPHTMCSACKHSTIHMHVSLIMTLTFYVHLIIAAFCAIIKLKHIAYFVVASFRSTKCIYPLTGLKILTV